MSLALDYIHRLHRILNVDALIACSCVMLSLMLLYS